MLHGRDEWLRYNNSVEKGKGERQKTYEDNFLMNGIERAGKTTTIIQGIYDFIGYVLNFLFFFKNTRLKCK